MKNLLLVAAITTTLTACGGGGDSAPAASTPASTPAALVSGVFLDSPVEGLIFTTPSNLNHRKTGEGGRFTFIPGEIVSFYIGNRKIGHTRGEAIVTPLDLEDDDLLSANEDDRALNVLRILQTLDSDGDPSNGITIPDDVSDVAINFNQTTEEFETDPVTIAYVADSPVNAPLVTAEAAVAHFEETLATVEDEYVVVNENWDDSTKALEEPAEEEVAEAPVDLTPEGYTSYQWNFLTTTNTFYINDEAIAAMDQAAVDMTSPVWTFKAGINTVEGECTGWFNGGTGNFQVQSNGSLGYLLVSSTGLTADDGTVCNVSDDLVTNFNLFVGHPNTHMNVQSFAALVRISIAGNEHGSGSLSNGFNGMKVTIQQFDLNRIAFTWEATNGRVLQVELTSQ